MNKFIFGVGVGVVVVGLAYLLSKNNNTGTIITQSVNSVKESSPVQQYKNNKTWEISRNSTDAITSIKEIVDAKIYG